MDVQKDRRLGGGWAGGLGRALAALWTRMRAALRRWAPALPPAGVAGVSGVLPAPPPGSVDGDPQAMLQGSADPAPAPGPVEGPQATAAPEVALVIEEAAPARAVARAVAPAIEATWSPEVGAMRVRQFFGRIVMAAPGAADVDLAEWPRLSVERFFLAIGSPRALARREPPTSGGEAMSLGNAFEGFEWD